MSKPSPDVYSAREIAAAAGVPVAEAAQLMAGRFVPLDEAVRIIETARSGRGMRLLARPTSQRGSTAVPLLVSTSLHAVVVILILVIGSLGLVKADEKTLPLQEPRPMRMVFLAQPGPGGGGGGGGLKAPAPPPKAERKGTRRLPSPVPARTITPPVRPAPPRPEPPPRPIEARQLPPVTAPVATSPADDREREGVLAEVPERPEESRGPGSGGGTGSGQGTGIGEGNGSGIGPGEGGGTGGGPYRPGSGVEPPRLLHEVRADYTEQARRAGISGEVILEIVVRRDGSVGDVRVLEGLGSGLDQRAAAAVRQWRFAPARMKGTPVDVMVEVAVEFRLR